MDPLWSTLAPLWQPLLLLLLANGAPILARVVFADRFAAPLDGGMVLRDGRPLFGPTKSWRGLIVALLLTALGATVVGLTWQVGVLFGLFAMGGDALASFIKRRLNISLHGRALGLDQLPEALLPLWLLQTQLGLSWQQVVLTSLLFMSLDLLISPLLYRIHIRLRPY